MNNEQIIGDYTISHNEDTVLIKVHPRVIKNYLYYSVVGAFALPVIMTAFFSIGYFVGASTIKEIVAFGLTVLKFGTPSTFIFIFLMLALTYFLNRSIFIHFDNRMIVMKSKISSKFKIDKLRPFEIKAIKMAFKRPIICIISDDRRFPEIVNLLHDIKRTSEAEAIVAYLKKVPGLLN